MQCLNFWNVKHTPSTGLSEESGWWSHNSPRYTSGGNRLGAVAPYFATEHHSILPQAYSHLLILSSLLHWSMYSFSLLLQPSHPFQLNSLAHISVDLLSCKSDILSGSLYCLPPTKSKAFPIPPPGHSSLFPRLLRWPPCCRSYTLKPPCTPYCICLDSF